MTKQITIESVSVKHVHDENPDLSWLGEFIWKTPDKSDLNRGNIIPHETDRDGRCYFVPQINVENHRADLVKMGYSRGTAESMAREYVKQDYRRLRDYGDGWVSLGIIAEAVVSYPIGGGNRRLETLTSGGLWGVESDGGEYLEEIEKEQINELKGHLEAFGVDISDFGEMEIQRA